MRNFMIVLAGLGLFAFVVMADGSTILFIVNNIIWLMVVAILMMGLVVVVVKALGMRQHNITIIDNRSWSTDNSTHTTTSQSYFDHRSMDRLEDSRSFLGVPSLFNRRP